MRLLPSVLGLTLTSVVALASANAADVYVPSAPGGYKDAYVPVMTWTGFYLGAHGGGAWGDLKVTDIDAYAAGATPGTRTSVKPTGAFGGGTLGYNWQSTGFVFGIEADLGGMDLNKKRLLTGTASGTQVGIDGGFYGDVTGRLGFAWGPTLIYAKGGFAFYDGADTFSTVSGSFSRATTTGTFTGWTLGGGIEYMVSPSWSLKAEYLHFDFGHEDFTVFNAGGTPFRFKDDLTVDTVKVGINYHFHSDYVPLK